MEHFYVLLVEDNEDLRRLFLFLLLDGGFEVTAVEDGKAALNALCERKPDAVVTDLSMPNLDGLELIKWIRSQDDLKSLPVIAMTAYGETLQTKAEDVGANRVIAKPVDRQLCYELNRLLANQLQTW